MLVSELISQLQKLPSDYQVLILYDNIEQEPNFVIFNDLESDDPIVRAYSSKYSNFVIHDTYLN